MARKVKKRASASASARKSPAKKKTKKAKTTTRKKAGGSTAAGTVGSRAAKSKTSAKPKTPAKPRSRGGVRPTAPDTAAPDLSRSLAQVQKHLESLLATVGKPEPRSAATVQPPVQRATTAFQRLAVSLLEDQLSQLLPKLIELRQQLNHVESGEISPQQAIPGCLATLDQILEQGGAQAYDPRPGQAFDPLIHLAVGEIQAPDLEAGAVAEVVSPGFRTRQGQVLAAARVRINRR